MIATLFISKSSCLKVGMAKDAPFDWYNLPDVKAADFVEKTIDQRIDHFDPENHHNFYNDGNFKQRYWINDKYVQ